MYGRCDLPFSLAPPPVPRATVRVVDVYPYRIAADGLLEFLVLRRADGRAYAGQWRMVGGKIEEGEAAYHTALRELDEETGYRPGKGLVRFWSIPSLNVFYEWTADTVALTPAFACEVSGDPELNAEHDAFTWMRTDDVARLAWPEQQRLLSLAADLLVAGPIPPELEIPLDKATRGTGNLFA